MFLINKLEQKDMALEYLKEKTNLLETNLENNKLFLNMVVHDMRNPTNQIEYTLQQSIEHLDDLKEQLARLDYKLRNLEANNLEIRRNRRQFKSQNLGNINQSIINDN